MGVEPDGEQGAADNQHSPESHSPAAQGNPGVAEDLGEQHGNGVEVENIAIEQRGGIEADHKAAQGSQHCQEEQHRFQVEHTGIEDGVHGIAHESGGEHNADKHAVAHENPQQEVLGEPAQSHSRIDDQSQTGGNSQVEDNGHRNCQGTGDEMGKNHLPAGKGQGIVDIHRAASEVIVHELHGDDSCRQHNHHGEQHSREVAIDLCVGGCTQGKSPFRRAEEQERQLQGQGDEFQQEEQGAHQTGAAQIMPEHGCQAGVFRR